jgi:hypothetical protein
LVEQANNRSALEALMQQITNISGSEPSATPKESFARRMEEPD